MADLTAAETHHQSTPSRIHWISLVVAVGWVLFSWSGRIRNVAASNSWAEDRVSVMMAASFLILAAAVLVATGLYFLGSDSRVRAQQWITRALLALAGWSTIIWVIRVIGISLSNEHEIGFKIVHAVLGVIGISTSVWAANNFWNLRGGRIQRNSESN